MKIIWLVLTGTLVLAGGLFGYADWQRHQQQDQQLLAYEQHVKQLLTEVEAYSTRRLETQKQIDDLDRSLTELRSQLASANDRLQLAQQQANPEYEAIVQRVRREVRAELQAQRPEPQSGSKTGILRQLAELEPAEVGELMNLQSIYGGFLSSLNVDDARMETIVETLSRMVAEQNRSRRDAMRQMRQATATPEQFREQMQAIASPEAQAAALSFVLTDEEMALFNQFQASQPQQALFSARTFTTVDGARATIEVGTLPDGSDAVVNYEIIATDPNR